MKHKKRLCLFAGFDKNGEVADYVVYYLEALAQISDVYYWGDFKTSDAEKAKLKPFCKKTFFEKHGKYDFGSWQELIYKIGRTEIEQYDEVIIANDSCYGPLFDLSTVFQEMDQRDCDFWGLSSAYNRHIHLQSYFIVLKKPVICSDTFYNFFEQVKPEANYNSVCLTYEDRFTYILSKAGFHFASFITHDELENHPYQDIVTAIKNRHFPLLKVKFFLGGIRDQGGVDDWRKVITEYTNYPVELIERDLERRGFDLAKIDQSVREKRCKTPDFYQKKFSAKRVIRKTCKVILKPALNLLDLYMRNRTMQYDYRIKQLNRAYYTLQQEYDSLKTQLDPEYTPEARILRDDHESHNLQLINNDTVVIKRPAPELPLNHESDVLLIGNILPHNLDLLNLYGARTISLNNDWNNNPNVQGATTRNLCNFSFTNEHEKPVYFDFILTQPLSNQATDQEIDCFVTNLKRQMIFESTLVMLVRNADEKRYQQILQAAGLQPANAKHSILAGGDPFQAYYDIIGSIKGYKTLVYKIK